MPDSPVPITVIGGTSTGHQLTSGVVKTEGLQPNLLVNVVNPLVAILVRFGHTLGTLMVGIITAGMVSDVLPVEEFTDLFWVALKLSFSGAAVGAIKDVITILGKLEGKFPLLSGGV